MRRLAIVALLLVGCAGSETDTASTWPEPAADAIRKVTESGPVKATVQVWPAKPTLGDPLWLRLTVESAAGTTAVLPLEIEALGRFGVTGWDKKDTRRADGAMVQIRNYELALPSSGKHRIPPLRLEISDQRSAATQNVAGAGAPPTPPNGTASSEIEILTDEIPIEVAPVLSAKTNAELRAHRGRLDPEVGRQPWWPFALGGAAVLALAAGIVAAVRRARARRTERARISAYDEAMKRFAALEGRGAPDADTADAWFVDLSSIVRQYLESRFALRAPELTTEEFLQEARRAPELTPQHREQLSSFLEECDRVKFAGYRPDPEESLAMLRGARAFVEETRATAAPPPAAVAHPRAA